MPINLPPQAIEAERQYRAAQSLPQKITCLEAYISAIPKHKGTDRLRADLRKRLSKLKNSSQGQKTTSRQETAFHIDKEGAGQVVITGPPNVGKSSLVASLTHAAPTVADAPFTTWAATPGMMPVHDIQVQLVDTPPLHRDYVDSELIELIRRADLLLLMVDIQTDPVEQLEDTAALLAEHRIISHQWKARYAGQEHLVFLPLLVLANKWDDEQYDENVEIFCELLEDDWLMLPMSAKTGRNIERLKQMVFDHLNIMRIYTKPPWEEPDFDAPYVLKKGDTVADFAGKVHRDFVEQLKSARVWGSKVHDGQMVGQDHILHDGDVVELRT
jgi:small GTP-binding protein